MDYKVVVYFLFQLNLLTALYVGDKCVPNNNYAEGMCTLFTKCELAVRQLQAKRSHDFKRCGFDDRMEIVCCPQRPTDSRFGTSSTTEKSVTVSKRIADRECQKIIENAIPALDLHILGGVAATLGEFPHMVGLGFDKGNGYVFDCGGALISKDFVLTAAHCVDNAERIEPSIVRTGVVEIGGRTKDDETDVDIAEIIRHPQWTRSKKYHDMALLRLSKPLSFTEKLNVACLDTNKASNIDPSESLLITGWGQTSNTRDARSTILLKANVTAVARDKCGESYDNWRKLPQGIIDNQLCAGDPNGIRDTCQGDSGGPLQTPLTENIYRLVGITSFGRGCGSFVPGVYTRVSKYVDWIESVVWPQN